MASVRESHENKRGPGGLQPTTAMASVMDVSNSHEVPFITGIRSNDLFTTSSPGSRIQPNKLNNATRFVKETNLLI